VVRLDLRGKVCPYPTTEVYRALQSLPAGERIEVISDYVPARFTVPALVKDLNCTCELRDGDNGLFTILIEKPMEKPAEGE
jgi:TusA-related sulfurtransferase